MAVAVAVAVAVVVVVVMFVSASFVAGGWLLWSSPPFSLSLIFSLFPSLLFFLVVFYFFLLAGAVMLMFGCLSPM